jgi:D-amino-acid dehydrogenase
MTKRVDTLVIGGGSVGVCIAYFLSRRGREVTVVDQGQVGAACSYGNAGVIAPSHIIPLPAPGVLLKGLKWMWNPESPLYIKPRLDLALLSWLSRFGMACRKAPMVRAMSLMRQLTQASMALYQDFALAGAFGFHFKQKGSLMIYKNLGSFEASVKEAELLKPYGITCKVLGYADVRQIEPRVHSRAVGGIYFPEDAHLNPYEFVTGLASCSLNDGVKVLTSTEVLGFETSGERVSTVRTTRGDFVAEQVVLAAGSWSPQLVRGLGMKIPIQPAKGYSITVRCSDRDDSIPVWLSETKVIVTPMGGILRFAGTLELAGLDFSISQRRVGAIQRAVREYLVGMDDYELLEIWRGLRPLTPDGLPIIGKSHRWTNLTIATGHGMQGLALGPITGKLVAQLVCGETPSIDLTALREQRFS